MSKSISELPDRKHADDIGLKHVSNGYVGWLVDGDGNEYFAPLWLLDLLRNARGQGHEEALSQVRSAIGLEP